ncbi:MAG: hypothetical protein WD138_00960, partial [Halofilum sp. (in: g-proteobacteria)]
MPYRLATAQLFCQFQRSIPAGVPAGWLGLPALGPSGLLRFAPQRQFAPGELVEPAHARTKTWCLTAWLRP